MYTKDNNNDRNNNTIIQYLNSTVES